MVLKFKDLNGNWNFKEGEISYRFSPFCDVIINFLEQHGYYYSDETTGKSAKGKTREEIIADYEKFLSENVGEIFPNFFGMVENYLVKTFDRAGDAGMKIDLSCLVSQNVRDLFGVYFIEIYQPEKLETDYILLHTGDAYLLGESGRTIEKLI